MDDDPGITESIKAILKNEKDVVLVANTGTAGLETARKENISLVLYDIMMEKVDEGIKVANDIKIIKSELPIYLLSSIGDATAGDIEIEKLGFTGIFQKPVSSDYLNKVINKTLNKLLTAPSKKAV